MDPWRCLGIERRLEGQLGVQTGENGQLEPPSGRVA